MSIAYPRTSRGPVAGRLAGKVVAISGTGGGQGRAAALLFAPSGATVVGCDRRSDGLEETRELVEREGSPLQQSIVEDLAQSEAAKQWIDERSVEMAPPELCDGIRSKCFNRSDDRLIDRSGGKLQCDWRT